jgi:hypothetical protein
MMEKPQWMDVDPPGERVVVITQWQQEEEDSLVVAVDQEAGCHHGDLRDVLRADVGHELAGDRVGCVQGEAAGGGVPPGFRLHLQNVAAVTQFRQQQYSDVGGGVELSQGSFLFGCTVTQSLEGADGQREVATQQREEVRCADRRPVEQGEGERGVSGDGGGRAEMADHGMQLPVPLGVALCVSSAGSYGAADRGHGIADAPLHRPLAGEDGIA